MEKVFDWVLLELYSSSLIPLTCSSALSRGHPQSHVHMFLMK